MNDDLVKRLRSGINNQPIITLGGVMHGNACLEAADRIEELEAKLAKAVGALRDIARQKRTDELAAKHCAEFADFEGGYDACVGVARAAIKELTGEAG